MKCPYCGEEAEFVDNKEIYGKRYGKSYMTYWCRKDDARVGTHNNTQKPLGTMANAELRKWRTKVHKRIDPMWQGEKYNRKKIYQMLKDYFGREIHIGSADIETCKEILKWDMHDD